MRVHIKKQVRVVREARGRGKTNDLRPNLDEGNLLTEDVINLLGKVLRSFSLQKEKNIT